MYPPPREEKRERERAKERKRERERERESRIVIKAEKENIKKLLEEINVLLQERLHSHKKRNHLDDFF